MSERAHRIVERAEEAWRAFRKREVRALIHAALTIEPPVPYELLVRLWAIPHARGIFVQHYLAHSSGGMAFWRHMAASELPPSAVTALLDHPEAGSDGDVRRALVRQAGKQTILRMLDDAVARTGDVDVVFEAWTERDRERAIALLERRPHLLARLSPASMARLLDTRERRLRERVITLLGRRRAASDVAPETAGDFSA